MGGGTGTLHANGTALARNTAMTLTPAAPGDLAHHWLGRSHHASAPVFAGAFGGFDVWSRVVTAAEITGTRSGRGRRQREGRPGEPGAERGGRLSGRGAARAGRRGAGGEHRARGATFVP
ncbi:hypothetical protein ACIRPQ_26345 [Streptomyces sp. NPDC101213]|uniref:hypothetical protein n=1 Tax=Streptomyces sp. NPDC101213 TaxID=3366130 RepID=UPI00381A1455